MADDDSDREPDSGPFCRHWADPVDCEVECAGCGHTCNRHTSDGCYGLGDQAKGGCPCEAFVDETVEKLT